MASLGFCAKAVEVGGVASCDAGSAAAVIWYWGRLVWKLATAALATGLAVTRWLCEMTDLKGVFRAEIERRRDAGHLRISWDILRLREKGRRKEGVREAEEGTEQIS